MNKKTALQVVMVLVIIIISLWFYLKYFTKNFEDLKDLPVIEKIDKNQNNDSTYINDINYTSIDVRGNKYQITAKLAEIKIENSDLMFLSDVVAFIFIKDSGTVKITSNFGKFLKGYVSFFDGFLNKFKEKLGENLNDRKTLLINEKPVDIWL